MAIEAISGKGVNRAKGVCDDCGREEVVPCDYERAAANRSKPNEGQAKKKLTAHGWAVVKGNLYCPTCEAKRKVVPMKAKEEPKAEQPKEPSKAKKREIIDTIKEFYDDEAGRYKGGETDETIADLCEVMPGWVAKWREELFGPAGGNEEMDALRLTLDECGQTYKSLTDALHEAEKEISRIDTDMKAQKARMDSALSRLVERQPPWPAPTTKMAGSDRCERNF